jgi:hypothetical protein
MPEKSPLIVEKSTFLILSHAIYTIFLDTDENETAEHRHDFTRSREMKSRLFPMPSASEHTAREKIIFTS